MVYFTCITNQLHKHPQYIIVHYSQQFPQNILTVFISDPAIKQFIMYLNAGDFKFAMTELDDTHIFLNSTDDTIIQRIQQKIDELQDENTYSVIDNAK